MLKLPTHVQLEITDICNLRCKHCYHFDTEKMPQSLDLEEEEIIKLVQILIDAKIYSLVITGGEPLTRPETTLKVVKIAKEAGMFVSINTNLLLINHEIVHELKACSLDSFLVSCPASNNRLYREITRCGNYEKLASNIKLVVDAGVSCMVNMVVTPVNINFVRSTATDLRNLGIKRFAATPASLNVESPNYTELLDGGQINRLLEDLRWCIEELCLEVDILEPIPKCFFRVGAGKKIMHLQKEFARQGACP